MILCSWTTVSKLNVVVLRQTGHFFDENNLKLHGQCFWLLNVARGVVLNDHLKMLEMFMFVTGQ